MGPDLRAGQATSASGVRGSATVWVLALTAVLCAVAVGAMLVGQARVARHRAGVAADLAALAGAERSGDGTPCKRAAAVARVNGGKIVACAVRGEIVDVVVEMPLGRLGVFVGQRAVRARARAEPGAYGPQREGPRGLRRTGPAFAPTPPGAGR